MVLNRNLLPYSVSANYIPTMCQILFQMLGEKVSKVIEKCFLNMERTRRCGHQGGSPKDKAFGLRINL